MFSVSISFAQFGVQGQKVLGGTVIFNAGKFSNSRSPEIKPYSFSLGGSISVGKFTKENLLKNASFSYIHGSVKNQSLNNIYRNYLNSVYLTYGLTKYKKIANSLFFGIGGNAYTSYSTVKYHNTTLPEKGESYSFAVGVFVYPALSYQLNNRLVVNLSTSSEFLNLGFGIGTAKTYSPSQPSTKDNIQSLNLNAGLFGSELKNLTFGFSYLLKNKATKK